MILVVSHGQDVHVPFVTSRLDERGVAWTLLDTDAYPTATRITDGPTGAVLTIAEQSVELAGVSAVWWRRPRPPQIRGRGDETVTAWAQRQAFVAMASALNATRAVWVNHPRCNRRAEDKADGSTEAGRWPLSRRADDPCPVVLSQAGFGARA